MSDTTSLPDVAREVTLRWEQAWNSGDAASMVTVLAEDADWVTVSGKQLKGKEQIQSIHAALFAGSLKGTTWASKSVVAQAIAEGVALLTYSWTVTGELDSAGGKKPSREGLFSWVLVLRRGSWLVRLGHATNVLQG